ncbi:nuclease-related domain-containing protein [Neobacillus cucumis]|uniref:nuclease-related domain-containing protein n=1 Tax=Neobacillus cucumis TaxID=1740721 RepID=UPI002E1CA446|nr:nuclease-related domain-containing protein [Neobacillus cucumis]
MILNERPIPIPLLQREALLRRLPKTHSRYHDIEKELINWKTGYSGEKNVDYYLSYLPDDQYRIMNDLRLKNKNTFQIDTLIMSQMFGLVLEIKNITGTLFFDQNTNGVIRRYKEIEEGISNPLTQAKRHRGQLMHWNMAHKLKPIPIEYLVVFSRNSTILKTNPGNEQIFKHIIYAEYLEEKVAQIAEKYQNPLLKGRALTQACDYLLSQRIPSYPDILKTYSIPKFDIRPGVPCPKCQALPMIRVSAAWFCSSCKTYSKNAHLIAVKDFFLLMNAPLTVRDFQEFLIIEQRGVAKYLLHTLHLPADGNSKRTAQYFLPPDCILSLF